MRFPQTKRPPEKRDVEAAASVTAGWLLRDSRTGVLCLAVALTAKPFRCQWHGAGAGAVDA